MATTRIWSISGRLDFVINYVKNPEKTDGSRYTDRELQALQDVIDYAENPSKTEQRLYVTGINVSPDIARDQMVMVKQQFGKMDKILAYHGYQSFLPGEVTPDQAHKIGIELAKRLWGDKYQVLVTTHLDKNHLHNHFCLNSVSFTDGYKFRGGSKAYWLMRAESDRICAEHGLSVIKNPGKGKNYAEWKAEQEGKPTIRSLIREELDEIIKGSYSMKSFWEELDRRGYIVYRQGPKYTYTTFIPPYGKKGVRLDKLGAEYTEEAIKQRIIYARNHIKPFSEPEVDRNAWLKKYEPIKLKGFKALYYHYMYYFGILQKRETPQRLSFYMREEIIKFERYQEQFKFLYNNDLETSGQVQSRKDKNESRIKDLVHERSLLYYKPDTKEEIEKINKELKELRKDVRMCVNILADSERISKNLEQLKILEEQAKMGIKIKPKIKKNDEITR